MITKNTNESTNAEKSPHEKLVDCIHQWWIKRFLGSATKLVQERLKGLIHSSLFTMYMLVPIVVVWVLVLIFSCSTSDGFWKFVTPILSILIFSPIAYKLWTYRTADREKQDNFAHYSQGVQLITSNGGLQQVTGINLLIRVSKQTSVYDEEIKYMFVETLKKNRSDTVIEQMSNNYAQSITTWLYRYYLKNDMDSYIPTTVLFIQNQVFDLTDKVCSKSFIWLLLLAGDRQGVISHFSHSAISYRTTSHPIEESHGTLTVTSLLESIKSRIQSIDPGHDPNDQITLSNLSSLLAQLEEDVGQLEKVKTEPGEY